MCGVVRSLCSYLLSGMKKNLQVIGYQPDTLCTRKDLQKFDDIWWASTPNATITHDYIPKKFQLTEAAKAGLVGSIHFIKSLHKL